MTRRLMCAAAVTAITIASPTVFSAAEPPAAPSAQATAPKPCDLASFSAPADTTLTAAAAFTSPVSYCRVDGYVTTTNPGPNKVHFMVAMPANWNGRYLFTVQGGAAGFVPDPAPNYLSEGYAIASTDKGVKTSGLLDFSFRKDPAMALDWAHRGMHVAAVASQAVAHEYYSAPKMYRYVMGCSGGGHGSLTEAERYPEDFDAFLPGAQGYSPNLNLWWGAIAQHIDRNPKSWISPDDLKRVADAIMQKYDASDGAVDGLIRDPEAIKLDRSMFPFLNDDQYGTLELLSQGIHVGSVSYPGYWMSNPEGLSRTVIGPTPPPWGPGQGPALFTVTYTGYQADRGPTFNALKDIDYTDPAQMDREGEAAAKLGAIAFDPRHLAALKATGHKVIMWSGAADNAVPPRSTAEYTRGVTEAFGPERSSFFRTFFAPGMFHCIGGDNQPTDFPDTLLQAAVAWVEKGIAPDFVVADNTPREALGGNGAPTLGAATGQATRTYLICSYPARSVFKGGPDNPQKLDVNDAKNWRCEA